MLNEYNFDWVTSLLDKLTEKEDLAVYEVEFIYSDYDTQMQLRVVFKDERWDPKPELWMWLKRRVHTNVWVTWPNENPKIEEPLMSRWEVATENSVCEAFDAYVRHLL